jgi:hypothetical protein
MAELLRARGLDLAARGHALRAQVLSGSAQLAPG